MKKLLALLLSFSVLLTSNAIVFANDINGSVRNEVEEKVEEKQQDGIVSYLAIANPSVSKGQLVSIVAGVASEDTIEAAVLRVTNTDQNINFDIEGQITDDGNLLFESESLESGCYAIKSIIYEISGNEYTEMFEEAGIAAQFGVDTVVIDDTPDAVVTDEDSTADYSEDESSSIVVDDGISEYNLSDSIDSAIDSSMVSVQNLAKASGTTVIVLDPGHGGHDGGASSSFNGKTYLEKELNLKIAQYCKAELETYSNVKVYMTRSNDTYVGLEDRVNYAKSVGATVFVSIHNNSTTSSKVHGATVYYPNSNYKPQLGAQGQALAQSIVTQLVSLGLANHGAVIRNSESGDTYEDGSLCDYYSVIRNSKKAGFPGIIIEHAYLSNASDAATYLGSDSALRRLGVADANGIVNYFGLKHATPGTEYNGINYELVFDPTYYMDNNSDVKSAVGGDAQKALEHFVKNGINEGRIGRPEFDVKYYKEKFSDLQRAFGDNLNAYYMHYLNNGVYEGRQACEQFDVISYKARYADLRAAYGDNLKAYVLHYINFGKNEGRDGSKTIDVYTVQFIQDGEVIDTQQIEFGYSAKAPANANKKNGATLVYDKSFSSVTSDLVINIDARYIYNGIDYTDVFDADYYLAKYADLKKAFGNDGVSAMAHFVNFGMYELRQANEMFDVKSYKNLYPDLRRAFGNDAKSYYFHYINNGKREGRTAVGHEDQMVGAQTKYNGVDYSSVYDFNYYIAKNPDVLKVYGYDENKVLGHFVNFGMKEGRSAKEVFSVKSYKNRYPDLRRAFGNNAKSYFLHYINNGIREKRIAIGCDTTIIGAQTKYNGIDYGSVYDFNCYVSKNPDVLKAYGYDENKVLAHFVNFGMKEGRRASEKFNLSAYKNRYADLRKAFGNKNKLYYLHYIGNGKKENRIAV